MRNNLYRWVSSVLVLVMLVSALGSARPAQAATAAAPRPERKLPPLSETLAQIKSQVVVRFKESVTADRASAAISATNGRVLKNLAFHNTKLAAYSTDAAASNALAKLNASEDVVYAFYNKRITIPRTQEPFEATAIGKRRAQRSDGQPLPQPAVGAKDVGYATGYRPSAAVPVDNSDPLRTYQYHLDRIGEPLAGAPEASAPTVAVIDSGLDYTVPDLSAAYQRCPSVPGLACELVSFDQDPYDTNGHGTHAAGVIASRSNKQGARGVLPTSKILPVRIFGDTRSTDLVTIFEDIDHT